MRAYTLLTILGAALGSSLASSAPDFVQKMAEDLRTGAFCVKEGCTYDDGKGHGWDLSYMCSQDGSGYLGDGYNPDGSPTGLKWNINVCGTLQNQCNDAQVCVNATGFPTKTGTQCKLNTQQPTVGMAIQQSWKQQCVENPLNSCNRCEVAADKPSQGVWSMITDDSGVLQPASAGIQVTYPPVSETANEDASWNSCTNDKNARTMTYRMFCDCTQITPLYKGTASLLSQGGLDNSCNYVSEFHGIAACYVGYCGFDPAHVDPKMSGGWKFMIVVMVGSTVLLGFSLARNKSETGEFGIHRADSQRIKDFTSTAREGMQFVVGKVTGNSSGASNSLYTEFNAPQTTQAQPSDGGGKSGYTDL